MSTIPTDILATSLPARTGPYRSLSAKRPRDPSHRKSVSFNDVPIVHEVPSHDAMRNANCTTFRSWTYTDTTPTTTTIPSFYSAQLIPPFNASSSAAAQKIHANRLSSSLYSSLSTNTTASRIPDWALRAKTAKAATNTEESGATTTITTTTTTHDSNANTWTPPVIIVHTPDEKTSSKDLNAKSTLHSTYNNPYITGAHSMPSAPPPAPHSSLALNTSDNHEEKKQPYRAAIVSEMEHHRTLPFTYEPVSDSTATYTSMLSTNIIAPSANGSTSEQGTSPYPRAARARSATLPLSTHHHTTRGTDSISITPFRAPSSVGISNGNSTPSRTVLRPTTIAFQCGQPNATNTLSSGNTNSNGTTTTTTINATLAPSSNNSSTKPPTVPLRFASSAAAVAAAHSRFGLSSNRTLPHSGLVTSTIKYAFAHPTLETTLHSTHPTTTTTTATATTNTTGTTPSRPPPTAYPRSRSANVLNPRRHASAVENHANSLTTNPTNSLYSTTKRNPNVRQNYGSYYMHRVLLPTTIN